MFGLPGFGHTRGWRRWHHMERKLFRMQMQSCFEGHLGVRQGCQMWRAAHCTGLRGHPGPWRHGLCSQGRRLRSATAPPQSCSASPKAKRLRDNETIALKEINMPQAWERGTAMRSTALPEFPGLRRRLKNANEEIERELR